MDPNSARLHYNLSLALMGLGDHDGQKKELETAIQLDANLFKRPPTTDSRSYTSQRGSVARAKQALKTALAIEPQFAAAPTGPFLSGS